MQAGMNIGHNEGAIRAAHEIIMAIVTAPAGDNVKVAALDALTKVLSINGVAITNCQIVGDTMHNHYPEQEKEDDEGIDDIKDIEE